MQAVYITVATVRRPAQRESIVSLNSSGDLILVLIAVPNAAEAGTLSGMLLQQRLAACVSHVSGVDSRYWWNGLLESATEDLLLVKTRADLWPELLDTVRAHHSYDVPEVLALPIWKANPSYETWIHESTQPAAPPSPGCA